jgi:hypothetical protein
MPEKPLVGTDAERARFEQAAPERRPPGGRSAEVVPRHAIALVITASLLGTAWR